MEGQDKGLGLGSRERSGGGAMLYGRWFGMVTSASFCCLLEKFCLLLIGLLGGLSSFESRCCQQSPIATPDETPDTSHVPHPRKKVEERNLGQLRGDDRYGKKFR